tara:strand:- start:337 stop:816 length:480 start_codon:yes stop_codon:yes gene_type:complete
MNDSFNFSNSLNNTTTSPIIDDNIIDIVGFSIFFSIPLFFMYFFCKALECKDCVRGDCNNFFDSFCIIFIIKKISNYFKKCYTKNFKKKNEPKIIIYSQYNNSFNDDNMCSICLENLEKNLVQLKCGHIFHKNCIDTWYKSQKNTCPICRNINECINIV